MTARAWWVTAPGRGEIREESLPTVGADQVLVRTTYSAVSRGTESLVYAGRVPQELYQSMRAPFQAGQFPAPVKYGYLNVGVVEDGPDELLGRHVFCLYPHQDVYVVPRDAVAPVPDDVPARRAVLAGNLETAVNALWDAGPRIGDRACVVGAGTLGCCVARLLSRIPGVSVTLVDVNPDRADVAEALGVRFAGPDEVAGAGPYEVVVHASHSAAGLACCLGLPAPDGTVVELSWYGTGEVCLPLGGAFHVNRLAIRASQVGTVAPARQATRSRRDRLQIALSLLRDPAYDALLGAGFAFDRMPEAMPAALAGNGLTQVIDYANRQEQT